MNQVYIASELPQDPARYRLRSYYAAGPSNNASDPVHPAFAIGWYEAIKRSVSDLEAANERRELFKRVQPRIKHFLERLGFYAILKVSAALSDLARGVDPAMVWNAEREDALKQLYTVFIETRVTEFGPDDLSALVRTGLAIDLDVAKQRLYELAEIGRDLLSAIKTLRNPPPNLPQSMPKIGGLGKIMVRRPSATTAPAAPTNFLAAAQAQATRYQAHLNGEPIFCLIRKEGLEGAALRLAELADAEELRANPHRDSAMAPPPRVEYGWRRRR